MYKTCELIIDEHGTGRLVIGHARARFEIQLTYLNDVLGDLCDLVDSIQLDTRGGARFDWEAEPEVLTVSYEFGLLTIQYMDTVTVFNDRQRSLGQDLAATIMAVDRAAYEESFRTPYPASKIEEIRKRVEG